MTRSGTDLLVEERRLFHDLFDRVLDQSIDDVWFRVDDPEFSGYPPTTWQRLADQANLAQPQQRYDTSWCYKFAPRGWLRGVKGLESDTPNWHALPTPDSVRDRLAMLCRTLKASIAGRNAPHPVGVLARDIEATSGIGRGWIQDTEASHLLAYTCPAQNNAFSYIDGGDDADLDEIRIPSTFGHPRRD